MSADESDTGCLAMPSRCRNSDPRREAIAHEVAECLRNVVRMDVADHGTSLLLRAAGCGLRAAGCGLWAAAEAARPRRLMSTVAGIGQSIADAGDGAGPLCRRHHQCQTLLVLPRPASRQNVLCHLDDRHPGKAWEALPPNGLARHAPLHPIQRSRQQLAGRTAVATVC